MKYTMNSVDFTLFRSTKTKAEENPKNVKLVTQINCFNWQQR